MSENIAQVKGNVKRLSDAATSRTTTENRGQVGSPSLHPAVQEWKKPLEEHRAQSARKEVKLAEMHKQLPNQEC